MQIESLSKRLGKKLNCQVTREDIPMTTENYWRVVKRLPLEEWSELSAAQITIKVVDPALDALAAGLNEWGVVEAGELPMVEDDVVACTRCVDGKVPVRMLLCPDGSDIVIIFDILARKA